MASNLPSKLKAIAETGLTCFRTCLGVCNFSAEATSVISHSRTVLSLLAMASNLPSGLKAISLIGHRGCGSLSDDDPAGAVRTDPEQSCLRGRNSWPEVASHRRAVL